MWGNVIQITHLPHTKHLKKVIIMNHDIKGCKNIDQCDSKLSICPKGTFFGKFTKHHFCLPTEPDHPSTFETNL